MFSSPEHGEVLPPIEISFGQVYSQNLKKGGSREMVIIDVGEGEFFNATQIFKNPDGQEWIGGGGSEVRSSITEMTGRQMNIEEMVQALKVYVDKEIPNQQLRDEILKSSRSDFERDAQKPPRVIT